MTPLRFARFFLSAFVFLIWIPSTIAVAATHSNIGLPLTFEENKGQAPPQYLYLSRHNGVEAMFLPNGVDLSFPETADRHQQLALKLSGSNKSTRIVSLDGINGRSNYLLGADPSRWIQGVPNYSRIKYEAVYPGIDLVFYGNNNKLEHDFQLKAGADVSHIALNFEGAEGVDLSPSGELHIQLKSGVLILDKPLAYQETAAGREPVRATYAVAGDGTIKFKIGKYDHTLPLVIDPALNYATYLDKLSLDIATIAVDSAGSTYIAGITFSSSYPVTSGAFQSTCNSCSSNAPSVFVTKLNQAGTAQVYSTYLGGSAYSQAFGLAVDSSGNAVVVGYTRSTDFPIKNQIGSGTFGNGTQFGFISSLTPDGSALNYSSLLGGGNQPNQSSTTIVNAVALDGSGDAYISGITDSPVFPTTAGALNSGPPAYPASIAFVSKFVPAGTLGYSALIGNVEPQNGGGGLIGVEAIAVDPQGSAYIAGGAGTLWPTTPGAYLTQIPGTQPFRGVFVTKLSPDASSLSYSTFLGVGGATAIVLDSNLDAIVTGNPDTASFPVTSNAYLSKMTDCCAFLSKVSPDGSQLLYSTFLGSSSGSGNLRASGLALDPGGDIWLTGSTTDSQFPLLNPLQTLTQGNTGFVSEFDPTGTTLKFSTFFGGSSPGVNGIAFDPTGKADIVGTTVSGIYTTPGVFLGSVTAPPQNVQYTYGYVAQIDPAKDSSAVCFASGSQFGLSFGYVSLQKTVTSTVAIKNCGTADLSITSIQISNPAFSVPAASNNCGSVIAPGASCSIAVNFTPTTTTNYSGTLTFTSNASIPTISLATSGIGAVPVVNVPNGLISFSPMLIGQTTGPSLVEITNTGNDNLIVDLTRTTITGDFAYSGSGCSSPLARGGICFLSVTFSPTQAGTRTGTLSIATNDPVTPLAAVSLSGMGVASYPVPTITSFDQPTIPTGTSPVSIQVYGTNFFPASVVRINAQPQQTTYVNGTTLRAVVDPALRTSLGELSVTVFNPTPGGGESNPADLTLYQTLLISPSFVVSVPATKLLYAAIPAYSATNPNTIIPIDPTTGTPGTPIPVGKDPRLLAVSSDSKYLFVALYGDQAVQRINLQTSSVERTFPYPPNPFCTGCSILAATDMEAVPGVDQEVVLSQGSMISLYNDSGLVNAVPTTYTQQINPPITGFAFAGTPSTIYALPFTYVKNSFLTTVGLNDSGLSYTPVTGTNFGGNNTTGNGLVSDGSLLYTNAGQVWNPATQTEVGTFPVTTYNSTSYPNYRNIDLDTTLNEIYVIGDQAYGSNSSAVVLSAYGIKSLALTNALAFPRISDPDVTNLVRWGSNGFAFIAAGPGLTDQELYLVQSNVLAPPQPNNPLPVLSSISPTSTTAGGSAFTLTLNGTGFLPSSTTSWNGTALQTTYVSSTQLTASVPASDIAQSGTAQATVTNPGPGGGTSSAQSFTVVAAVPQLASSASSLDFGSITQGVSSSAQTITLTNAGTATLNISSIAASSDFSQTNTCGATLAINATCQIAVVFTPTAIGPRTGTLTLSDNATGSPQSIALSGTGVQPLTLGAGSGGSTSATVPSGQPATYNLSLSSSSGFSGTATLTCTGAPQYATCYIVPSTLTLPAGGSANFTVTVSTSTSQTAYLPQMPNTFLAGLGLLSLFSAPMILFARKRTPVKILMLCVAAALLIPLAACSRGSGSKGNPPPVNPAVTPPGTYTLTVTAAAGAKTVAQNLTLIVQ